MQALPNCGLELRLRLWSPPCGGYCRRHTAMVRMRARVRATVMAKLRDRGRGRPRVKVRISFVRKAVAVLVTVSAFVTVDLLVAVGKVSGHSQGAR